LAKHEEQVFLSTIAMVYIGSELERLDGINLTISKIVNREMTKIAVEAALEAAAQSDNDRQEQAEGGK